MGEENRDPVANWGNFCACLLATDQHTRLVWEPGAQTQLPTRPGPRAGAFTNGKLAMKLQQNGGRSPNRTGHAGPCGDVLCALLRSPPRLEQYESGYSSV